MRGGREWEDGVGYEEKAGVKELTTSTHASLFSLSSSSDALLTGAPVLRAWKETLGKNSNSMQRDQSAGYLVFLTIAA